MGPIHPHHLPILQDPGWERTVHCESSVINHLQPCVSYWHHAERMRMVDVTGTDE
jgi:hypothetical protein